MAKIEHVRGKLKTNKVRGNPRAGRQYVEATDSKGRKVHRYFDKSGTLEKSVVVAGAIEEARKRSTIPIQKYSKKKASGIKGSFGPSGRNRIGYKN